jgi:hypothetical protein
MAAPEGERSKGWRRITVRWSLKKLLMVWKRPYRKETTFMPRGWIKKKPAQRRLFYDGGGAGI